VDQQPGWPGQQRASGTATHLLACACMQAEAAQGGEQQAPRVTTDHWRQGGIKIVQLHPPDQLPSSCPYVRQPSRHLIPTTGDKGALTTTTRPAPTRGAYLHWCQQNKLLLVMPKGLSVQQLHVPLAAVLGAQHEPHERSSLLHLARRLSARCCWLQDVTPPAVV
jgi:hypothetical protein